MTLCSLRATIAAAGYRLPEQDANLLLHFFVSCPKGAFGNPPPLVLPQGGGWGTVTWST